MLTDWARGLLAPLLDGIAGVLGRIGMTPNMLTLLGGLLHLPVAWLLAEGRFIEAAALFLVATGMDGIDGTLARLSDSVSDFGAFLDSSVDRISEVLIFLGLLSYAVSHPEAGLNPNLVYMAMAGSLMVSYTRARAESAGLKGDAGWFTRFERMIIIWLGLLSTWLEPALLLIAVGAWLTAAQRIHCAWRSSSSDQVPETGQDHA